MTDQVQNSSPSQLPEQITSPLHISKHLWQKPSVGFVSLHSTALGIDSGDDGSDAGSPSPDGK